MSIVNDGGLAFPQPIATQLGQRPEFSSEYDQGGMSLRDYFAGKALNAMGYTLALYGREKAAMEEVAASAYRAADAMIAQRGGADLRLDAAAAMLYALKNLVAEVHSLNDDKKETRRDFITLIGAEKAIADAEAAGIKF